MTKANSSPSPQPYVRGEGDLTDIVQQEGISPDKLEFRFKVLIIEILLLYLLIIEMPIIKLFVIQ